MQIKAPQLNIMIIVSHSSEQYSLSDKTKPKFVAVPFFMGHPVYSTLVQVGIDQSLSLCLRTVIISLSLMKKKNPPHTLSHSKLPSTQTKFAL